MDIRKKWTVWLKNGIESMGNVASPAIDLYDRHILYVADGMGAAERNTRFRKLSLKTGEELASVVTRSPVRSFCMNREYIFTGLNRGKRILKLNRDNLQIETVYKKNVPEYADHISLGDARTLLIMNNEAMFLKRQGYIYRYDMITKKIIKKKIGGWCCGMEKVSEDTFLVFNADSVLQYSLKTNTMEKLFDMERGFCVRGGSGRVYLRCQKNAQKIGREGKTAPYSSRLLVYPPTLENKPLEIVPGILFTFFWLSEDESLLYCCYRSGLYNAGEEVQNALWVYSIPEGKVIFQHTFDSGFVINVFAEEGIVLTYDWNKKEGYQLTCWEIVT